jgi:hypothetical protein
VHDHVKGTADGEPYSASDPTLLLWVHATFVDSGLVGCELFGTPADADAYVREMAISAALLGVPEELIPTDSASLSSFITSLVPRLALTPAAQDSASYLLDPPGMEEEIADLWQEIRNAVLISLPSWALHLYGLPAMDSLTASHRSEIIGTLGVLDAVFMGEPGVLETRQRITLRMRAA